MHDIKSVFIIQYEDPIAVMINVKVKRFIGKFKDYFPDYNEITFLQRNVSGYIINY